MIHNLKLIRNFKINVENSETLHSMGKILYIFGGVVLIYSIVSFTLFTKGIDLLKFLFLTTSSVLVFLSGIILRVKADVIAHKSIDDRRWHYFVIACPIVSSIVIIVLIEELYNCTGCIAASLIFSIVCILIVLMLLMMAHVYKKFTSNRPLEVKDLDNYSGFRAASFVEETKKEDMTPEQKQQQVTERLEKLSDKEFEEECKKLESETSALISEYINPVKIENTDDQVHGRHTVAIIHAQLESLLDSSDDEHDTDDTNNNQGKNEVEY